MVSECRFVCISAREGNKNFPDWTAQNREQRMPRLTRAQSKVQTRKKLVDSARAQFARIGYGATTIEQIAESAGFSKGAFYSNFGSKDDLALEIAYQDVTSRLDQWIIMVSDRAGDGIEAVVEALRAGADSVNRDVDRDRLQLELILHGTRHAELGNALRNQYNTSAAKIRNMIRLVFAMLGRQPPIDASEIANLILLIHYGRKALEITDIPHAAGALTEVVFRSLFATAPRLGVTPASD
jgi:AcrR family transcriptional regulator